VEVGAILVRILDQVLTVEVEAEVATPSQSEPQVVWLLPNHLQYNQVHDGLVVGRRRGFGRIGLIFLRFGLTFNNLLYHMVYKV